MAQLDIDALRNMRVLLKESDFAFSIMVESSGSLNTDYADYASNHFIYDFRHVMQKPDLSRAQLAAMLRHIQKERECVHKDQWTDFMANVLTRSANDAGPEVMQ